MGLKRTRTIPVRFSDAEHSELMEGCEELNIRAGQTMRKLALEQVRRMRAIKKKGYIL